MPGVGVGVIILNSRNEVLLLLRNQNPDKALSDMHLEGTWTLPAGKVKKWETLQETAIRKVKEETDLEVKNLQIISIADDINEYAHFVTVGLIAEESLGTVDLKGSQEQVDYGYFPLDKLPKNTCPPTLKIIDNYKHKQIYKRWENEK